MTKDFPQIDWSAEVAEDCREIVRLAIREDLDRLFDWTTLALVPSGCTAEAAIVVRQPGVVCGLKAIEVAITEMDVTLQVRCQAADGDLVAAGHVLATLSGSARSLLTAERILLNLVGRLSGIATLTQRYVQAIAGSAARIYDTRKTTPGWRRLEKYATRCGGARNHRLGLYDAILIKDNHLALAAQVQGTGRLTIAEAVIRAREFVDSMTASRSGPPLLVEVEVDTFEQLAAVLPAQPDLILLDNMSCDELRHAVSLRNSVAPTIELEASGGVSLETVAEIAGTGVERISVGALTHAAASLDVGLDWL